MRPRFLPLISSILSLVGCGVNPITHVETASGNLSQAQVDAIVEQCGGPLGMAKINGGKLVIKRAKDSLITSCVLDALRATGEITLREPLVGNQRYQVGKDPEEK